MPRVHSLLTNVKLSPLNKQFEPLITKDNLAYVHHMVLYNCIGSPSHLDKWAQHDGVQCYTSNMPPSWYSCTTTYIAWAVGSEGESVRLSVTEYRTEGRETKPMIDVWVYLM